MDILPIEVLANHIFKYFTFADWMNFITPVCKLWQQAAIISTAPKQMWLDLNNQFFATFIPLIAKYRIATLILQDDIVALGLLERALNASPKLNTLVFAETDEFSHTDLTPATTMAEISKHVPEKTFPYITTLAITEEHFALLQLFPNVTRLRIQYYDETVLASLERSDIPKFPKVRELEVACDTFGSFDRIKLQFPSLEILYVTAPNNIRNGEISAEGKQLGIKVYNDNPHMDYMAWSSAESSYYLFALHHGCTQLRFPLEYPGVPVTAEELEKIMKRTSPTYERELHSRMAEFHFPARVRKLLSHILSDYDIVEPADPVLLRLLYINRYMSFWETFDQALKMDQLDFALELSKDLADHLQDPQRSFRKVLKLFEKLGDLKKFLDVVGSEATKKIMATSEDGKSSILVEWVLETPKFNINLGPIDECIDWHLKTKIVNGSQVNLATLAFRHEFWSMWRMLVEDKKVDIGIDHYGNIKIEKFIRHFREDIAILGRTPEALHRVLFLAPFALRADPENMALKNIIAEFGSDKLIECLDGNYLLHYILQRTGDHYEINNIIPYLVTELGLDINYIDKSGKTPLVILMEKTLLRGYNCYVDILEKFLSLGANPNLANTLPPLFLVLESILSSFTMNACVVALLDHGADINAVSVNNSTPLSTAVSRGISPTTFQLLMSRGADTKFIDNDGNTLFHALISADNIIALIPLLASHVDINQKNFIGETPLQRAKVCGADEKVIQELLRNGAKN
jgi:hypothetical protein